MTLLNGKDIQYARIKIPCCRKCNNERLSKLENQVKAAFQSGHSAFCKLSDEAIFLWSLKIFYELLHLEKRTYLNPAKRHLGRVISAKQLERYGVCHMLLRALLIPTKFTRPHPWSIFIYKLQTHRDPKRNFFFRDNTHALTITLRMGSIGLICCLQDGGAVRPTLDHALRKYERHKLHPLQFLEIAAVVNYTACLLNRVPKYVSVGNNDQQHTLCLPLGGFSTKPIFDDWQEEDFVKVLASYCKVPLEEAYMPAYGTRMTFLNRPDGSFNEINDGEFS